MPEEEIQMLKDTVETLKKQVELLLVHQHLDVDGSLAFQGETEFKGKSMTLSGGVVKNNARIVLPFAVTDGQDQEWLSPGGGQRVVSGGIQIIGVKGESDEQVIYLNSAAKPGTSLNDESIPTDRTDWTDVAEVISRLIVVPQGAAAFSGPSVLAPLGFLTVERTPIVFSSGVVTTGGNTLTDSDAVFTVDAFVGSILVIYDTAGLIVEAHQIVTNTANVITIGHYQSDGSIAAETFSVSGGYNYSVRTPVLLGTAEIPYTRLYVGEDIRLGYGSSGGDQTRYIKWGVGEPEGIVVANIGSIYTRFDGTADNTLYVKSSDNGLATGWQKVNTSTV